MNRFRIVMVAAAMTTAAVAVIGGSAQAAPMVSVDVRFRIGYGNEAGHTISDCPVKAPSGSNGIRILQAAKRAGCIDSYVLFVDDEGTRAGCIDGICESRALAETPGYVVWDIYYPPLSSHFRQRLEGFKATERGVLRFHYIACAGGC